jgi:hypothetical protein
LLSAGRALRSALLAALLTVAFVLLFGHSTLMPLVLVPVVIGILAVVMTSTRAEALTVGAAAALLGKWASLALFDTQADMAVLRASPAYMRRDISLAPIDAFIKPLLAANPANTLQGPTRQILVPLLAVAIVAAVVLGFYRMERSWRGRFSLRSAAGAVGITIVAISFSVSVWQSTLGFREYLSFPLEPGTYATDMLINAATYNLMLEGKDFYSANLAAVAGDKRDAPTVVGGKSRYWGVDYPWREPWVWWLWTIISPGGPAGLFTWALALAAAGLVVGYIALLPYVGESALIAPVIAYPAAFWGVAWANMLHTDWWAMVFVLASMALLMRKRIFAAGLVALAAALGREVLFVWLGILVAVAIWQSIKRPVWRKPLALFLALVAVFALAYVVHLQTASGYLDPAAVKAAAPQRLNVYIDLAGRPLSEKLLAPASYLMFPYGAPRVPTWLLLPLGALGFWLALRKHKSVAAAMSGYLLFWFLFYLVIGATSTYWGMHTMPLALAGTSLLIVDLAGRLSPDRAAVRS